jgi:hypothetical protein
MTINPTELKERIATSDTLTLTHEERDFVVLALATMPSIEMPSIEIERQAPPNYMGRISAIWAYLSVDDGGEGICGAPIGLNFSTIPLIAADKARLDQCRPIALSVARSFGKPVRLVRFHQREDVELIRP